MKLLYQSRQINSTQAYLNGVVMINQEIITMQFSKSTKGTHVYTDDSDLAPIPTLYIKRASLPKNPPESIKLTVEYNESL